ncbi:MAG: hypothetical protein JRH01_08660 [Deltaproteobacteria bacterium]|nr:hypothetical protein [Deltaproteobacteria bacterium]MBW2394430.1 hypothetical protein [Deltaproteobacteria bacterium]
MRFLISALVLLMILGCESGDASGSTQVSQELADKAYALAQQGKVHQLRTLLEENPELANAPVDRGTALLEIVVDIRPEFPAMHQTIEVLLLAGADPNLGAPEILRVAIWRGDPEALALLLKYGADPLIVSEKKKMNMLEYARALGDERLIAIVDEWEAKKK